MITPSSAYSHAVYLHSCLPTRDRVRTIDAVVRFIRRNLKNVSFDSVAFSGMSGALVAPAVAARLRKETILVRKANDLKIHDHNAFEGYMLTQRYLIIDDFACSGKTIRRIKRVIRAAVSDAKCIGAILYNQDLKLVTTYADRR